MPLGTELIFLQNTACSVCDQRCMPLIAWPFGGGRERGVDTEVSGQLLGISSHFLSFGSSESNSDHQVAWPGPQSSLLCSILPTHTVIVETK